MMFRSLILAVLLLFGSGCVTGTLLGSTQSLKEYWKVFEVLATAQGDVVLRSGARGMVFRRATLERLAREAGVDRPSEPPTIWLGLSVSDYYDDYWTVKASESQIALRPACSRRRGDLEETGVQPGTTQL